jgi:hypothetical protein
MKRILIGGLAGAALFGLSACNNDNHTAPFSGEVRVVNGIPDSGSISASATSGISNTAGVGFDGASSTVTVPEGGYNVQLSNNNNHFATVNNVSVDHNNITTLYARGSINGSTGTGFAAEENLTAPASGNFTFQFVNGTAQDATRSLSIYLVPVGGGIGTHPAVATQNAGTASGSLSVAAGTYEIIVTSGTTPLYDSGTSGGITLPVPNTNVIQIGALDGNASQQSADGSPITLIITDNIGGATLHHNGKS